MTVPPTGCLTARPAFTADLAVRGQAGFAPLRQAPAEPSTTAIDARAATPLGRVSLRGASRGLTYFRSGSYAVSGPAGNASGPSRSRVSAGFTLVELLVVAGIILLIVALAVPAFGPILRSNELAEAAGTIGTVLATAQSAAQFYGTWVAAEIGQAGEPGPHGLAHQQVRFLALDGISTERTGRPIL